MREYTEELTAQEVYDIVVDHLLGMTKQCGKVMHLSDGSSHVSCMYRGEDGVSACAVGRLLTDKEAQLCEGIGGVDDLVESEVMPDRLVEHRDLLSHLQGVHDADHNWGKNGLAAIGRDELARVAVLYGLNGSKLAHWAS